MLLFRNASHLSQRKTLLDKMNLQKNLVKEIAEIEIKRNYVFEELLNFIY